MINFFSKIRFLLTHILPPTTIDLSDGTWNARKGLPDYEKIYLRNNVRTKKVTVEPANGRPPLIRIGINLS